MKTIMIALMAVMAMTNLFAQNVPSSGFGMKNAAAKPAEAKPAEQKPADVPNYKGVPWGASFEQLKSVKENMKIVTATRDQFSDYWMEVQALLGVKQDGFYMPANMVIKYVVPEDTFYVFSDDRFVFCYASLNISNETQYRSVIAGKYKKDRSLSTTYVFHKLYSELSADLFRDGQLRVYLISRNSATLGLVYMNDPDFDNITSAVFSARNVAINGVQDQTKQDKDLDKIQ